MATKLKLNEQLIPFEKILIEDLSSNPSDMIYYLEEALEAYSNDGDIDTFEQVLMDIEKALKRSQQPSKLSKRMLVAAERYHQGKLIAQGA